MGALAGLGSLPVDLLRTTLSDPNAALRRTALSLSEPKLAGNLALSAAVLKLVDDPDPTVRYQLALTLGEWDDAAAPKALANLAASAPDDPWMRAAVLSSSARRPAEVLAAVTATMPEGKARAEVVRHLAVTLAATAAGDAAALANAVRAVTPADGVTAAAWNFAALAAVLDAAGGGDLKAAAPEIARTFDAARAAAADAKAAVPARTAAIALLGRGVTGSDPQRRQADLDLLSGLLRAEVAPAIQSAAVAAVGRAADAKSADALIAAWPNVSPSVRPQVFDALVGRREWVDALLDAVEQRTVRAADVSAAQRDRLLKHADAAVRTRAERRLAAAKQESRAKAVEQAKPVLALKADPAAGAAVFNRACASCHQLNGVGHAVGPNLAAITDRSGPAVLTAIIDPNAAVEGRYAAYAVETTDGRSLSGLIADETAAGFTVVQGGGVREAVARSAARKVSGTGLSLMPEGLEAGLKPQELADLVAYVQSNETPQTLAALLLNGSTTDAQRGEAIARRPDLAVEAVRAMTADLRPGTPEEYVRIPTIWRVGISVGKRNDADEVRRLLAVSLPPPGQPLHDWQAVVVGGAVINGISLSGAFPAERVAEALKDDADLLTRWRRSIDQARAMADDPKVKPGTRYDALRMIAMAGWEQGHAGLTKYLAKDVHPELQMGAVSGLSDVRDPRAADALLSAWPNYTPGTERSPSKPWCARRAGGAAAGGGRRRTGAA
jgi:putative heme-binding domain-containing protein